MSQPVPEGYSDDHDVERCAVCGTYYRDRCGYREHPCEPEREPEPEPERCAPIAVES